MSSVWVLLLARTNKISVVRIYKVHRAVENAEFRNGLCNKRYLFHASTVKNFVGILSRLVMASGYWL